MSNPLLPLSAHLSIGISALLLAAAVPAATLDRPLDPVVVTGAEVTALLGEAPGDIVAFRYEGDWVQIPVQVDERVSVDFEQVYDFGFSAPIPTLAYADPGTYVGADTNPLFDADDEIALMAKDAGDAAPAVDPPAGVLPASGIEVLLHDPLDAGQAYVYLFVTDGSLTPDAGADYVSYSFDLLAGSYPADYDLANGPNPENTSVVTARYSSHFSDRWIHDEMRIFAGTANGDDILDRHRNIFAPSVCQRSEDTFSNGEGAFFANIDGPVRAIRSYMGANSGPITQRRHVFYEGRQDIETFLRVHAISGVMDLFDLSADAIGMTYYDDLNLGGVTVDGVPDVVSSGITSWQLATGVEGSLIIAGEIVTDIAALEITSYYEDDSSPSETQCTGDAFEYAQSGFWVTGGVPNTDPLLGTHNDFSGVRSIYYEEPGKTPADAQLRSDQATTPIQVFVDPLEPVEVPALPRVALLGLAGGLGLLGGRRITRAGRSRTQ